MQTPIPVSYTHLDVYKRQPNSSITNTQTTKILRFISAPFTSSFQFFQSHKYSLFHSSLLKYTKAHHRFFKPCCALKLCLEYDSFLILIKFSLFVYIQLLLCQISLFLYQIFLFYTIFCLFYVDEDIFCLLLL